VRLLDTGIVFFVFLVVQHLVGFELDLVGVSVIVLVTIGAVLFVDTAAPDQTRTMVVNAITFLIVSLIWRARLWFDFLCFFLLLFLGAGDEELVDDLLYLAVENLARDEGEPSRVTRRDYRWPLSWESSSEGISIM